MSHNDTVKGTATPTSTHPPQARQTQLRTHIHCDYTVSHNQHSTPNKRDTHTQQRPPLLYPVCLHTPTKAPVAPQCPPTLLLTLRMTLRMSPCPYLHEAQGCFKQYSCQPPLLLLEAAAWRMLHTAVASGCSTHRALQQGPLATFVHTHDTKQQGSWVQMYAAQRGPTCVI